MGGILRIALVNYRYFVAGGPERYLFNIKKALEKRGHTVIPFSVQNSRNQKSEYERLFLSPIGKGDEVYFSDYKKNASDYLKGFGRMVYSLEAKKVFKRFLHEVKPDIVYILYFQNKISCSIVDVAYSMKIPVVQRISDYSLLAPCDHLYDQSRRVICEKCLKSRGLLNALENRCVYNSVVYSAVKSVALCVQKMRKTSQKISKYIFPSVFTRGKFLENGFEQEKSVHIQTPFDLTNLRNDLKIEYEPFALYIGRIDPDKGLETLLDAFVETKFQLKIIGFSSTVGYESILKERLKGKRHQIEFLGKMDFPSIQTYLAKCLFTVVPSEWYDNLPNTLLESYAFGKCVVATDIGSLSEAVENGKTGFLFQYRNSLDLMQKCIRLFNERGLAAQMGTNALKKIQTFYSMEIHVKKLEKVFVECLEVKRV